MDSIEAFYNNNTEVSIAVLISLAIAFIIKPKAFGKVIGAIAIIAVIGYLISVVVDTVDTSIDKKGEAAHRTDKAYLESEKDQ